MLMRAARMRKACCSRMQVRSAYAVHGWQRSLSHEQINLSCLSSFKLCAWTEYFEFWHNYCKRFDALP